MPDGCSNTPPVVIVCNGLAAQCDFGGAPDIVSASLDAGCASVLFDYRHMGGSDGKPRNHVDGMKQKEDIKRVLHFVQTDKHVNQLLDSSRIALHGISNGGAYTLEISPDAQLLGVSAIIATVPRVSVPLPHVLRQTLHEPLKIVALLRLLIILLIDQFFLGCVLYRNRQKTGWPYLYVPLRGSPGTPAPIQARKSLSGTFVPTQPRGGWRNAITVDSLGRILTTKNPPAKAASGARVPMLLIAGTKRWHTHAAFSLFCHLLRKKATTFFLFLG